MSLLHLRTAAKRLGLAALPALVAALFLVPSSLHAADSTNLVGTVAGVELCPQIVCGAAVFVGRFEGSLDGTAGDGRWWVTVNHEELPLPGEQAPITGGQWGMVVGDRGLNGVVTSGSILNNGDGTFTVTPRLGVRAGGEGTLSLAILLDHGWFPPSVEGSVATGAVDLPAPLRAPSPTPTPAPAPR